MKSIRPLVLNLGIFGSTSHRTTRLVAALCAAALVSCALLYGMDFRAKASAAPGADAAKRTRIHWASNSMRDLMTKSRFKGALAKFAVPMPLVGNFEMAATAGGLAYSGSYDVGAGQAFTSLTNDDAGGIFKAINFGVLTGNVTINITSDLSGETDAIALSQWGEVGVGGYTVTIKPSGGPRTITSTATALDVIKLNGADRVTIDGSINGGTDRSLTLVNPNPNSGTDVIFVASSGVGAGAANNTIKNCILRAGARGTGADVLPVVTTFGILAGLNTRAVNGPDNDNLTIHNNQFERMSIGIQAGGTAAGLNDNLVIQDNVLGDAVVDANTIGRIGISVHRTNNGQIDRNTIQNVLVSDSGSPFGIALNSVINSSVTRNSISNVRYTGFTGYGGKGIELRDLGASSNVTVANNFISNIQGDGWNDILNDAIIGIRLTGITGGVKLYGNSVNLGSGAFAGNPSGTVSAALYVGSATTNLDIRDNILATNLDNTGTSDDKSFAIYSDAPNTRFTDINYNAYYATGVAGILGSFLGSNQTTIADWRIATGKDANSLVANPQFASATDLHITRTAPASMSLVENVGTPIIASGNDYDNDTRDATLPDIGADEVTTMQLAAAAYAATEGLNSNIANIGIMRTAGSGNAASVTLSMSDISATGGAACGGTVDYLNTPIIVNFAAGETFKLASFPICDDSYYESAEQVTLSLGSQTGSILGSPANASFQLNDNDPQPSASIGDVSQNETNSGPVTISFQVTLSSASGSPTTINYATADGSASSPIDYIGETDSIVIAATQTTGTIDIIVNGDLIQEPNETFTVTINSPDVPIARATGTGTILNDDGSLTNLADLSITKIDSSDPVTVGNSLTYTITVTNGGPSTASGVQVVDPLPANVTFVSASAGCTEITGTVTCSLGSINNGANASVQITVIPTPAAAGTQISNTATATAIEVDLTTPNTATQTTNVVAPGISINDVHVAEPTAGTSTATFTVTLASPAASNVTVDYATADGSATAPDDYTAIPTTQLTFTTGQTTQNVNVTIKSDAFTEGNENFFVNLSNPSSNATITDGQGQGTITNPVSAGNILISEFRFRGPTFSAPQSIDGFRDEYVELYNNTNSAITVATTDGSTGWTIASLNSSGSGANVLVVIPNGTVIPASGHFLAVNSDEDTTRPSGAIVPTGGYSLNGYAVGDDFYVTDVADNSGVAVFATSNVANFTLPFRLDAAGFAGLTGATADLFREGPGLTSPGANDGEYAFVRHMESGLPQDTDSNTADFVFVAPNGGTFGSVTAILGAPGPENCGCNPGNLFPDHSPTQHNADVKASLIEPQVVSSQPPNRIRDTTPDGCNGGVAPSNCTQGTLEIRRRFKNNTGAPVTRLRFRIVDVTTLNTPNPGGAQADIRWLNSGDQPVTTSLGNLMLRGTLIQTPPAQAGGGGLNSSGVVAIGVLSPGATIDVRFLLGVQSGGRFRFFVNVEALP